MRFARWFLGLGVMMPLFVGGAACRTQGGWGDAGANPDGTAYDSGLRASWQASLAELEATENRLAGELALAQAAVSWIDLGLAAASASPREAQQARATIARVRQRPGEIQRAIQQYLALKQQARAG